MNIEVHWHTFASFCGFFTKMCCNFLARVLEYYIPGIPVYLLGVFSESNSNRQSMISSRKQELAATRSNRWGCFGELQTLAAMANPPHDW